AARASGGGPPKQTASVAQEKLDPSAFFSLAWRWVRSLWEKNGMCIDPNGKCLQDGIGSSPSQLDQGPCIEPDGVACRAGTGSTLSDPDAGPHIDPNG
ncbi:MAG: hypothetical protein WAM82_15150, partial [Thermoanaerobaculia bacterium]